MRCASPVRAVGSAVTGDQRLGARAMFTILRCAEATQTVRQGSVKGLIKSSGNGSTNDCGHSARQTR